VDRLPAGLRPIFADLSDPASLRDLPGPFDAAFYTAGAAEFNDAAYRVAYVDGLRNLLEGLDAAGGSRRVIFTSSTAVYAQDDGSVVDETSPAEPPYFSGRRLLEGEQLLLRRPGGIVLRLGGIYGPDRAGLIDRALRGETARVPGVSRFINLIHVEDVAGALEHLMSLDSPMPVYIGVDNEPQDYNALVAWIAEQLGVAPPRPADAGERRGRPRSNRRCSNARLRASGYTSRYPDARAGYAPLIRMRRSPDRP
jgi:nucleoside-diphosphate-sugar epimerase